MSAFCVKTIDGGREFIVASRDIRPGEEIFKDEKPLLYSPSEIIFTYVCAYKNMDKPCLAYFMFTKFLSAAEQLRFEKLFSPMSAWYSEVYRNIGTRSKHPYGPPANQLHVFAEVCNVVRLYGFNHDEKIVVFENNAKLTHSCIPNSVTTFIGDQLSCRAVTFVKCGERITNDFWGCCKEPTHKRRRFYLERMDFTCHCPRCDAEADDTREFDCHDSQCPGSHFACQPINQEPLGLPGLQYTGVAYVEPHLLSCTECHRAAPVKYQQDMFALEKDLSNYDEVKAEVFMQRLAEKELPKHHFLSLKGFRAKLDVQRMFVIYSNGSSDDMAAAARVMVRFLEHIQLYPSTFISDKLLYVAQIMILECWVRTPAVVAIAKEAAEKAVRCHLIPMGRENRDSEMDETLRRAMQHLPTPPATTAQCMFCGESPLRAALTLSRCGRCRQVAYCSVGCQKAHWPLHKKGCKKTV